MTRRLISALLAAALLPLAAAPAMAGAPDRSARAQRAAQVKIVDNTSPFSPNGDRHQDRVAVRYRLTGDARVGVEVTYRGKTVFRTSPKAMPAGTRSFRWDGTRANGKRAADGRYRVVVRASAHGATRTDATVVVVRSTSVGAGTLKLSSDTVYPYAKVIDDVVVGNVHLSGEDWSDAAMTEKTRQIEASRAQVVDKRGHVIAVVPLTAEPLRATNYIDGPLDCGPCGRFTWDGRDSDGTRPPVGTYRIRVVHGRDAAGNVRMLTGTRTVKVSRDQLAEKTTVLDLHAADVSETYVPSVGCLGCDMGVCAPASSTRFPGGLTFDLTRPGCIRFTGLFTVPVAGRRTPYDWFDLSATGGPSSAGATASAELRTEVDDVASARTYPMSGDVTVSAGRHSMTANSEVYPVDWPQPVVWEVKASTGSYDIASFRVELHTYVPVS